MASRATTAKPGIALVTETPSSRPAPIPTASRRRYRPRGDPSPPGSMSRPGMGSARTLGSAQALGSARPPDWVPPYGARFASGHGAGPRTMWVAHQMPSRLEGHRRCQGRPAEWFADQERGVGRSGEREDAEEGWRHCGHDAGREAGLGGGGHHGPSRPDPICGRCGHPGEHRAGRGTRRLREVECLSRQRQLAQMLGLGGSGQRASRPCPELGCTDRLTEHSFQGRRGSLGRRLQGAPRVDARGHGRTENVDDLRNALLHLSPDRRRPTRSRNPKLLLVRGNRSGDRSEPGAPACWTVRAGRVGRAYRTS